MVVIRRRSDIAAHLLREAIAADEELNPREPGMHSSDLTRCLRQSWWRLHEGLELYNDPADDPEGAATMFAGKGHGAFLQKGQGGGEHKVVLPTPSGDITCTIDIRVPAFDVYVGEIKTTRGTSNRPVIEQYRWIEQVAMYCLAENVDYAVLTPLYLLGDYRVARRSQYEAFTLRFSGRELYAWSNEVRERAELLMSSTPPDCHCLDFERTRYCKFADGHDPLHQCCGDIYKHGFFY